MEDLKKSCSEDYDNEDSSDKLKQVCSEVLEEVEPLEENVTSLETRMAAVAKDIQAGIERSSKEEMTIEEIFNLLYDNVEVKKKLRLLLEDIDEFSKMLGDLRRKYLMAKTEIPVK